MTTCRADALRVAVLNVQSGAGTTRGWWEYFAARRRGGGARRRRIDNIGLGLRRAGVGLAILLEVDGGSARTGGDDQAARIARRSRLAGCAFFPCLQIGGEINQGNAMVATGGLATLHNHPLPGIGEPRYLSEGRLGRGGDAIHVFAAHTSLKAAVRRGQLEEIRRIVAAHRRPVLLGGDFNARKSDELDDLSGTLRRVSTGPTFPSWRPRWALDHLFVSEHFTVRAASVLHELREADHLPVVVDLTFDRAAAGWPVRGAAER